MLSQQQPRSNNSTYSKKDNVNIIVCKNDNEHYVNQCEEIAKENNESNGGTLRCSGLYMYANYIVCNLDKHKNVNGYIYISKHRQSTFNGAWQFYINQIAVKKSEQGKGIATNLVKYVINHSKGIDYFTSNINSDNRDSIEFHKKMGFENFDEGFYFLPLEQFKGRTDMIITENGKGEMGEGSMGLE